LVTARPPEQFEEKSPSRKWSLSRIGMLMMGSLLVVAVQR
jgi:hypothetical protein